MNTDVNITWVIVVSIVILILLFLAITLIHKSYEKKVIQKNKSEDDGIRQYQDNKDIEFVNKAIEDIFNEYDEKILKSDFEREVHNISEINIKITKKLTDLLNSRQYKNVTRTESNSDEKFLFLQEMKKFKPIQWEKRYKDEIEAYYGKRNNL